MVSVMPTVGRGRGRQCTAHHLRHDLRHEPLDRLQVRCHQCCPCSCLVVSVLAHYSFSVHALPAHTQPKRARRLDPCGGRLPRLRHRAAEVPHPATFQAAAVRSPRYAPASHSSTFSCTWRVTSGPLSSSRPCPVPCRLLLVSGGSSKYVLTGSAEMGDAVTGKLALLVYTRVVDVESGVSAIHT